MILKLETDKPCLAGIANSYSHTAQLICQSCAVFVYAGSLF